MTRHALAIAFATAAGVAAVPAPATAQNARDILEAAMERYEQRMSSINDYTVVQNSMGTEITIYYEKEMVDGKPVFVTRSSSINGRSMSENASQVMTDLEKIADGASYAGRQTIDGHATHAIRIEEGSVLGITEALSENAGEGFEAREITMYLDAEEYMPRRMEIEGVMSMNGSRHPVTSTIDFTDYREVDGLLHPFMTTFSIDGLASAMGEEMSPEKLEEAKQQIADFEKQMADMPESQRKMVERMMGDRIDQLRSMLESAAGGAMSFEVEVKEVRVNTGPPGN